MNVLTSWRESLETFQIDQEKRRPTWSVAVIWFVSWSQTEDRGHRPGNEALGSRGSPLQLAIEVVPRGATRLRVFGRRFRSRGATGGRDPHGS